MAAIKKFPDIKRVSTGGTFDALVLIDNKEINDQIAFGRGAGRMERVSGEVETQLAKHMGFQGKGTDLSKKADFQQFNLQLADQVITMMESETVPENANFSPATIGFIKALKDTAMGAGYLEGRPSEVVTAGPKGSRSVTGPAREGTQVGGLGAELKLSLEIHELGGKGSFSERTLTQETGLTQSVSPWGTQLRKPQAGFFMETLKKEKEKWQKTKGNTAGQFFEELLYNDNLAKKVFVDISKLKGVLQKTRNLFTLVSFYGKGKSVVNFLYFIKDLKPARGDISGNLDGPRIQWKYTTGFEKKVIARITEMLGKDGANALKSGTLQKKVGALGLLSLSNDLAKMRMQTDLNTVASIPIPSVANIKKPKRKTAGGKRQPRGQPRGQFISNVQLSAILQQRLSAVMPRYPEPQRPKPRYVTGGLAQSFQIMANYRTGLMGYFNTPPASGYVDELNQNGWMLDETLVEPTIRVITQQLFGRQFKVLRTQ
jgi:hypothetical protein